jgi:subtilisin family serine protease
MLSASPIGRGDAKLALTTTLGTRTLLCGDADGSGDRNISDVVYFIQYIFGSGSTPLDPSGGDYDCDGGNTIADAVLMVNWIFSDGAAPCEGALCAKGVFLVGDPDSLALGATLDLFPIAAASDDIDSTGFISTKLEAIINPTATVGDVNSALEQFNARISSMVTDIPFVSLMVPRVYNQTSAESLAALMAPSNAFDYVVPAYAPKNDSSLISSSPQLRRAAILPGGAANQNLDFLIAMRMPAAWNLKDLIPGGQKVNVFVPDKYFSLSPNPEISAQSFVSGGGPSLAAFSSYYSGNHGFHVSGIIGANFDNVGATGTHPDAGDHLEIKSLSVEGWDWTDILQGLTFNIGSALPGGKFVLNTSLGYNDPEFEDLTKFRRAMDMLQWRYLVAARQADFVHVTAAGNSGETPGDGGLADFSSPFCAAARFIDPHEMLVGEPVPPDLLQIMERLLTAAQTQNPQALLPLTNVIIVGSNDNGGTEYPGSCKQPDVRCIGEGVFGPCALQDPIYFPGLAIGCDGTDAYYTGTSQATPQVTGLAAYLWNLNPLLTVEEICGIILNSSVNGQVDGYRAVLSLDQDIFNAAFRLALLDVADGNGVPGTNGQFDRDDIVLFLAKFEEYEQIRADTPSTPADYSRYDLNGDGFTGGTTYATRFDLDINTPPQYGTLSIPAGGETLQFEENLLVDFDVLCYYARTSLYAGPPSALDTLMIDCPCSQQSQRNATCGCATTTDNVVLPFERHGTLYASANLVVDQNDLPTAPPYEFGPWIDSVSANDGAASASASIRDEIRYDSLTNEVTIYYHSLGECTGGQCLNTVVAAGRSNWKFDIDSVCAVTGAIRVLVSKTLQSPGGWGYSLGDVTLYNPTPPFQFMYQFDRAAAQIDTTLALDMPPGKYDFQPRNESGVSRFLCPSSDHQAMDVTITFTIRPTASAIALKAEAVAVAMKKIAQTARPVRTGSLPLQVPGDSVPGIRPDQELLKKGTAKR